MMRPISLLSVGSPSPEKVKESGVRGRGSRVEGETTERTAERMSLIGKKERRSKVFFVVLPHWQYMQSRVQVFAGMMLMPSERPRRRDGTGPYTTE
jgi:hypothetical protein